MATANGRKDWKSVSAKPGDPCLGVLTVSSARGYRTLTDVLEKKKNEQVKKESEDDKQASGKGRNENDS